MPVTTYSQKMEKNKKIKFYTIQLCLQDQLLICTKPILLQLESGFRTLTIKSTTTMQLDLNSTEFNTISLEKLENNVLKEKNWMSPTIMCYTLTKDSVLEFMFYKLENTHADLSETIPTSKQTLGKTTLLFYLLSKTTPSTKMVNQEFQLKNQETQDSKISSQLITITLGFRLI